MRSREEVGNLQILAWFVLQVYLISLFVASVASSVIAWVLSARVF